MQIGLGVLQKAPNYLVVLEYLPLPQYLFPRRASGSNLSRNNPQAESSDTSMEDRVGLGREHVQGPDPSSSSSRHNPNVPIDLNATQASFLAGAAVTQAHQASLIANNAADVALSSQLEVQHAQQVAKAIHAGGRANNSLTLLRLQRRTNSRPHVPTWLSRRKLGLPLSRGIITSLFQLLQMRAQQHVQGIRN